MTTTWLCIGGTCLSRRGRVVAVEHLLPGDSVRLRTGGEARLEWVGRLRVSLAEQVSRPALWPVHVAAGALAEAWPSTDTLVLPDCVLEVEGFVPAAAKWLVDGRLVRRPAPVGPLDIISVVLESQDAPEGLFLNDGDQPLPRPPDAALFPLRRHLAARGGLAPGPWRGSVDSVGRQGVGGWVADDGDPPCIVAVEVMLDGAVLPPVVADAFRADLASAGIGDGRRAFHVAFDTGLDPRERHLVRVRHALDGTDLPGSPALLDGAVEVAALLGEGVDVATLRPAVEAEMRALAARLEGAAR